MTREETLKSMTIWNAYAAYEESDLGSVEIGKRADLTVLDNDIMTIEESTILSTDVAMTIVAGEVVYTAP